MLSNIISCNYDKIMLKTFVESYTWQKIFDKTAFFTGGPIVARDWMLAGLAQCKPTSQYAHKIVPLSARQRNAIRMAFPRRVDSGMRLDAGWVPCVLNQYVV